MDYNNVWIFRVMCLNLSLSCFIKHYPEKFYHFLCGNYAEHWRLCAENKIVLDILPERYKPHFTYILSYTTKQRTSSCLLANCLHAISHFNSLPQLLTKSLKKSSIHKVKSLMNTRYGASDETWTRTSKTHAPQTCLSAYSSTLAFCALITALDYYIK